MTDEDRDRRAGGAGGWPDGAGDVLYQFAAFYRDLGRSLRSAAFSWPQAGQAERAAYLDELAQLRAKEQRAWATHLARPGTAR